MHFQSNWSAVPAADDLRFRTDVHVLPPSDGEATSYAVERASELLFKIQDETTGLILNAEILRALTRESQSNLEGHLGYLRQIKVHTNAIWDRTFDLRRIGSHALAWQRDTIAEVAAHGSQAATSTQFALELIEDRQEPLFKSEYRHHVNAIADASQRIRDAMARFFDRYMMQQRSRRQAALILATE